MFCRVIFKKMSKILASTSPVNSLRIIFTRLSGYSVGQDVYIGERLTVIDKMTDTNNLVIGDRVSIAPGVIFILSSGPNNSVLKKTFGTTIGKIIIEDDAWIGAGAILMPNITIGKCSIVGAGSVVTKDVKPFTKNAGIPSRNLGELVVA